MSKIIDAQTFGIYISFSIKNTSLYFQKSKSRDGLYNRKVEKEALNIFKNKICKK